MIAEGTPAEVRAIQVRPTHPAARPAKSLLLPAFWLVVGLLVVGGVRVLLLLQEAFLRYPAATILAITLFTLYAVPFWIFVGALDYLEREPPLLQATAFAWGALVATSTAITGNAALLNVLAKLVSPEFAAHWGPALVGPTIEEILKTLGVVAIVLIARAQINSVLDGMVYGALVGLGFQVLEDIIYAVNAVTLIGHGDQVGPVVATFFLRGFLAGLWSHTLFSALAGAGIGYWMVCTNRPLWQRLAAAGGGLAGAWFFHFLWNSPLLADGLGYGGWGVLAALVIKGTPALLMIMYIIRVARRRESDYYAAQLVALDDPTIVTPRELRALGHGRLRAQARKYAYARAGVRGRRLVRKLQRAQAGLAVALSRVADPNGVPGARRPDNGEVTRWRDEVLYQRSRLISVGHPEAVAPENGHNPVWTWLGGAVVVIMGALILAIVWAAIRALGGG
jgi:RsiW-degrading membrane proteinase PrsW (M82 family)